MERFFILAGLEALATATILYVITDLEVGGVPLHLLRLAPAMMQRGYRTHVVSLSPLGPVAERLVAERIEVSSCDGAGGWDIRVITRLARLIRTIRPEIVHALLFHANVASRLAARLAGLHCDRIICEIQTVEVERRWHLFVDMLTHDSCRFTIGNSPSVVSHLNENAAIPLERLRLVHGGIDPQPYIDAQPADKQELGLGEGDPFVVWVGRLDPAKGLLDLIEAFAIGAESSRVHLLLAGGGPLRDTLTDLVRRRGLDTRVHLLGPRNDIPSLLKAADVFVFPSRTEGLPNALLEAMAAGCPIVTTDVPGCRDLIKHMETGLVVPYGDVRELASAIQRLLDNPTLARRLADRAAHDASKNHHIDRMLAQYAIAYREIHRGDNPIA